MRGAYWWIVVLFAVVVLPGGLAAEAQGSPTGRNVSNLNVRSGPGLEYPVMTTIPRGASFLVTGRNPVGNWVLITLDAHETRGWVASRYVVWEDDVPLAALPVVDPVLDAPVPQVSPPQDEGTLLETLAAVPLVSGIGEHTRAMYATGQGVGNRPHVLARVGDCNSESYAFLAPLDVGNYDLGPYAHLQDTVSFFAGSFARQSVAARTGFSALSVLDALWADPEQCQPGESPLWCEYRAIRPAVAVIMFGTNDVHTLTPEQYTSALRRILDFSLRRGTIPLLSTFTGDPEDPRWLAVLHYNALTINLAREYDVPLMNFWLAARELPNGGMAADGIHLSYSGSPRVSFRGEETQWGFSARNLLTLQALDELRRVVLSPG